MTEEERVRVGTIVLVERYRALLRNISIEPKQDDIEGTGLPHILWMLDLMHGELLNQATDFDLWKANRWLGFIQRDIIGEGITTVTKERNYSRAFFKGASISPERHKIIKTGT